MKNTLLFFLLFLAILPLSAQFVEIDQLPAYTHSVYLDLGTRATKSVDNTEWDIAFNVGSRSSAILVNEAVLSSRSNPQREVVLYASSATDFAAADSSDITNRLYNGQDSWEAGAFNVPAIAADPFDLGWGSYSPATQTVTGSRVFFLTTRDGAYHKCFIASLAGGEYTFVHGPLDGSSADTVTIAKADYEGKTLAYYSLADGVQDLEPASWDLVFTRYTTPLPFEDGFLDYTVTGVLQNQGVTIAQVADPDPATASAPAEDSLYSGALDVIGFDWKDIDANFQFMTFDTIVYFARTADSTYHITFLDFTGASLGQSTLRVEGLNTTGVTTLPPSIRDSKLYPNPAFGNHSFLEFNLLHPATEARLSVIDAAGRTLSASRVRALSTGGNRLEVPLQGLPPGNYFVRLDGRFGSFTHHLVKH